MIRVSALLTAALLTGSANPETPTAPDWYPPAPPAFNDQPILYKLPAPEPVRSQPAPLRITVLRNVKVTACSPQDPIDQAYYAKHGYEGGAYGVAADLRKLPRGTLIRVPGYRGGAWHRVDSAGGSIIRNATRRGKLQIDVKFKTYYSSKKWGAQTLDVEVIYPKDFNEASEMLPVR